MVSNYSRELDEQTKKLENDSVNYDQKKDMKENEIKLIKEYVQFGYMLHCVTKIIFELIALYFAYWLQFQQSGKLPFFQCFTVPEKYKLVIKYN